MEFKYNVGEKVRIKKPGSMDVGIEGVIQSFKDVEGEKTYLIRTEKLGRFLVINENDIEIAWL